jgi:hypothetical protein
MEPENIETENLIESEEPKKNAPVKLRARFEKLKREIALKKSLTKKRDDKLSKETEEAIAERIKERVRASRKSGTSRKNKGGEFGKTSQSSSQKRKRSIDETEQEIEQPLQS